MVALSTRMSEMRGDGGNHHEKLRLKRISCVSQFTDSDTAGASSEPACNYTDTRSSNPIWQAVPLISHIPSYPPHCSHRHPPSLSFSSTTLPSLQNTKLSHPSLSLHVLIMSWHRVQQTPSTSIHWVQHTPTTASTQDCLSSLHSHDYELTPECSFSFWRASLHNRPPSASSAWELRGKVTLSHSHGCELTNWWKESQHSVRLPSTAFSSRPDSLDYGLQVCTIMASKCISKLAPSLPPSVSLKSLDYGLETCSIKSSKCISKHAPSWSLSASLSSLDHGLQVYLEIHLITASKCISKLARSLHQSVSLIFPDHHFQAHLECFSSTACSQSRYTVCK